MHRLALTKPDGRELILYGRQPLEPVSHVPAAGMRSPAASHLRWHPLRAEWVIYAGARQNRTFLPPADWDPLSPTVDPARTTEVPPGNWDVAVFENLFSALGDAMAPPHIDLVPTAASGGRCEVVVYTQDARGSLSSLPLERVELILEVWAERCAALARREDVRYVFVFENRGVEVGATLHHPHGQIYAYPFVPPMVERELASLTAYHQRTGRGLLEDMIAAEITADRRTLFVGEHAVAWVPICARWAYEVWVAPQRAVPTLADLDAAERADLARALHLTLRKLDALWKRPMPYVLTVHQGLAREGSEGAHVHFEIYPWLRMPDRMKFLAGSEVGTGSFTADTLPEDKAAELRAVEVPA